MVNLDFIFFSSVFTLFHRDFIIVLLKCLNSVFRVTFADLAAVNLLQTFESAVQENVSIKGQAWQEATDHCLMGMWLNSSSVINF